MHGVNSGFSQEALWCLTVLPSKCLLQGYADCCPFPHISSITSLFAIKMSYTQHYFRLYDIEDQQRVCKRVLRETAVLSFNLLPAKGRPT